MSHTQIPPLLVSDIAHNTRTENANSGNIFIIGDNLGALRHLVRTCEKDVIDAREESRV